MPQGFNAPNTRNARSGDLPIWDAKLGLWVPQSADKFSTTLAPLLVPKLSWTLTWAPLSFAANVSNLGSGFQTCQYAKDTNGVVHLRGTMTIVPAAIVNGLSIATLPVGFRPPASEIFVGMGSYGAGVGTQIGFRVDINVGGGMLLQYASGVPPDGGYLSIAGISFGTT